MDLAPESHSTNENVNAFQQSLPFYVVSSGRFLAREKYYTQRKKGVMLNYLLIVTTDGCGEIQVADRRCYAEKGSAVVIDCSLPHKYNTHGKKWDFYYAHFNGSTMEAYCKLLIDIPTPVFLSDVTYAENALRNLYRLSFYTENATYLQQSDILSHLLTEMACAQIPKTQPQDGVRSDIFALREYIRQNHKENLHVSDFIGFINLSRYYLIHLFEKQVGMTPYRFLHYCRIQNAQRLLKSTQLSITQIAYEVGYDDPNVFIRRFRAFLGITPKQYRLQ